MVTPPSTSRTVLVIFSALLVDLLGFTVILPLLPSLLEYYGENDQDGLYGIIIDKVDRFRELIGAPDTQKFNIVLLGGVLGSMYSLLQFFASPIVGAASDVYGRKPVILLTCVGVLLSYAIWAVSYSFPIFVFSRMLAGCSKGIVSISTTIVSDVTEIGQRSKGMAAIGIAFSLGFIFGPSIGAFFSSYGRSHQHSFKAFQYPAFFAMATAALVVLLLTLFLKESLPKAKRAKSLSGSLYLINPVSLFKYSAVSSLKKKELFNLRLMSASYFLYLFLFSGLEYSLTFLVHQRFEYTSMQQGKMFLFIGVTMTLIQGGYLRRRPPGTEKQTALIGMVAIIPGMLLVGWSLSPYMLYTGLFLYSFGAGTVVSCLTSIASQFGQEDEKGKVMGIFRSMGALARALGPVVACSVFWSYGACICYMIGGIAILLPLLMLVAVDSRPTVKRD